MADAKIYLDRSLPETGTVTLNDPFWDHYLTTVRRLGSGDEVEVSAKNSVASATLDHADDPVLKINEVRPLKPLDHTITIYQAITRKKKFEKTIKRGTELGVTKFVPLLTERTVRVPNQPEKQLSRWRKIATDAARISERDTLPTLQQPIELEEAVFQDDNLLLAHPDGTCPENLLQPDQKEVGFIVGPEGGFTEKEHSSLQSQVAGTVNLGPRNLRSETVTVALTSIWLDRTGNLYG